MPYYRIDNACQVGNFLNRETGELIKAPCKKWSCKDCGPRAARRFVARVLRTPRFSYFVTLTARPHGEIYAADVREFNQRWRSWKRWLKRNVGVGHTSWVLERGKRTGHLHRHVIVETGRSFSYKSARAALIRSGLGAVCDFKPKRHGISVRAAANYLGKYLGKHLGDTRWPRYTRRCQTSIPDIHEKKSGWVFIPKPRVPWLRRVEPDRVTPLESWEDRAGMDFGPQLGLALKQQEKVRQAHSEVDDVYFEKASGWP